MTTFKLYAFLLCFGCLAGIEAAACDMTLPTADAKQLSDMLAAWEQTPVSSREGLFLELWQQRDPIRPRLVDLLSNGGEDGKLLACVLLEDADGGDALDALLAAARDANPKVAAQALLALRRRGGERAAAVVRSLLAGNPPSNVLKAGLAALGALGGTSDLSVLRRHLGDSDVTVAVVAGGALAQLGDAEGEPILFAAVSGMDPQARREATFALGYLDSAESAQLLQAIVDDPNARWRTEAQMAQAMRYLRSPAPPEERARALSEWAACANDELAQWARERRVDEGLSEVPDSAKHATVVHGGGVGGDPDRCLTANAFALLEPGLYDEGARQTTAKGTVDEDKRARPINHFYNPVTGKNTMPLHVESALQRCRRFWDAAVRLQRSALFTDRLAAYHMLGRSLHLLQDASSPAHAHDDPHVPPIDPDDFEIWGETGYPRPEDILPGLHTAVLAPTVALPDGRTVAGTSPEGMVQRMALFTYTLTAHEADLAERSGPQPDSELARMFPDGRFYYQDAGLLGANYWQLDDVGRFGPVGNNAWWPCAGDFRRTLDPDGVPHIVGRVYLENYGGDSGELRPATFERPLIHLNDPTGMTFIDIYAAELYPECVATGAAFLEAFQAATAKQSASSGCAAVRAPAATRETLGDSAAVAAAVALLLAANHLRRPRK